MKLETKIGKIQLNNDENASEGGIIDVKFHLRDEATDGFLGFACVSVIFSDPSQSFEQIVSQASSRALSVLSQVLELSKAPANPEERK